MFIQKLLLKGIRRVGLFLSDLPNLLEPVGDGSLDILENRRRYLKIMRLLCGVIALGLGWVSVMAAQFAPQVFYLLLPMSFGVGALKTTAPIAVVSTTGRNVMRMALSAGAELFVASAIGASISFALWHSMMLYVLIGFVAVLGSVSVGILYAGSLTYIVARATGTDRPTQRHLRYGAQDPDSGTWLN